MGWCLLSFGTVACSMQRAPETPLSGPAPVARAGSPAVPAALPPAKPKTYLKEHNVETWVTQQGGSATFVSHNGHLLGMDNDAQVTLKPQRQAELTIFGVGVSTYRGTCQTDASGLIKLNLKDYRSEWPEMYLFRNAKSALLLRRDQSPTAPFDEKGRPADARGLDPYWPFRWVKSN